CTVEAKAAKVNEIGTITSKSAKIYKSASKKSSAKKVVADDLKRSFYVRESKNADKTTYYKIEKGTTVLGWVDKKSIKLTKRTLVNKTKKTMYVLGLNYASTMPAATAANKSYNLQIRRGKEFKVERYEKLGDKYWYKGKIEGTSKLRWIQEDYVTNNGYVSLNLRKPSNVSTKDLQALLLSKGKTPDNVLYRLAPSFIKAQSETGVNAQFMFAHAALETGWGSSTIAQYKNNLFGYQAYDTCALTCAKYFPNGEAGLKLYANKIVNNYLTQTGAYYNGMNVLDMNIRYATDETWGQKIAFIMQQAKPYSASYYKKAKPSTKKVVIGKDYSSEIPATKPQPAHYVQLPKAATGTVSTSPAYVYSIPYT
ncbi:MAG: glucosaminidase domain-containing protein, partial [Kurthia sp.]